MYYLRTKAASAAIQFTVDKTKLRASEAAKSESTKNGKKSGDEKSEEISTNGQGVSTKISNVAILLKYCFLETKTVCNFLITKVGHSFPVSSRLVLQY
jgi:hypothetical protein